MHASRFCSFCSDASELERTKRHVAHRASPRHCHARARCHAPCTRAHTCIARSTRRCTRASLASDARALTLQHALSRQHARMCARVTGHWLTVGRPAACASGVHTNCKCSRRARRADVHARCCGLISPDVLHVDVATVRRHETTNEMTTSEMTTNEMTTSETTKTSEKKYQTSGCARGPKNCETNRPSAQAPDPKSSKPHEL